MCISRMSDSGDRPTKKQSRFNKVLCLPMARSLSLPPRKSRHQSRVRDSSRKNCIRFVASSGCNLGIISTLSVLGTLVGATPSGLGGHLSNVKDHISRLKAEASGDTERADFWGLNQGEFPPNVKAGPKPRLCCAGCYPCPADRYPTRGGTGE